MFGTLSALTNENNYCLNVIKLFKQKVQQSPFHYETNDDKCNKTANTITPHLKQQSQQSDVTINDMHEVYCSTKETIYSPAHGTASSDSTNTSALK